MRKQPICVSDLVFFVRKTFLKMRYRELGQGFDPSETFTAMHYRARFLVITSLLAVATASQASFTMIERSTAMNVGWQYGSGVEMYPGSNSISSTSLNSEFFNQMAASESHSGLSEFGPWESGISYELTQEWGQTSNGFFGSASSYVQCFAIGDSFANIESRFPGNELMLHFSNDVETAYVFEGASTWMGTVHLERLQWFGWENVFTNPDMGGFTHTGVMGVGEYRLVSYGEAIADGNMSMGASWNYQLSAVPEPGTMAVIGLGLAALIRRRKRQA